jgi:hypothetical protein
VSAALDAVEQAAAKVTAITLAGARPAPGEMTMTPDTTALQRVWLCTAAVGLVRADRIVSMTVNNWRVSGARAEETAPGGDDILSAALVNDTKVILGYCGTSLGWRALADLAATMDRAAEGRWPGPNRCGVIP